MTHDNVTTTLTHRDVNDTSQLARLPAKQLLATSGGNVLLVCGGAKLPAAALMNETRVHFTATARRLAALRCYRVRVRVSAASQPDVTYGSHSSLSMGRGCLLKPPLPSTDILLKAIAARTLFYWTLKVT